ncbi:MAG: hypothetical protein NW207_01380 [Cytophagales bacterium]|nr:hypothetical protein [Cytophagales bacterium]
MDTNDISDKIELYVRGKLSADEHASMQSLINSNPEIAKEAAFQKTVLEGIKAHRAAILKSRLNNINTSTLLTNSYTALKMASVVVASAGLGLGAYYFVDSMIEKNEVSNNIIVKQVYANDSKQQIVSAAAKESAKPTRAVTDEAQPSLKNAEISATETKKIKETKKIAKKEGFFKKWSIFKKSKEPILDNSDADAPMLSNADNIDSKIETGHAAGKVKTSDVDIKAIHDGSHNFHYKLTDHVLYLYGDFDKSPYEILEFNKTKGQKMYLYYDENYYEMNNNTSDITKLKKLTKKNLVEQLNEARIVH